MPAATSPASILAVVEERGPLYRRLDQACQDIGENGTITVHHQESPVLQVSTGQRVRRFTVTVDYGRVGKAEVVMHLGTLGRDFYTGYEEEEFLDHYRISLVDGVSFADHLWREDDEGTPMHWAWRVVSPIKMAIIWSILARLLDGQPVVDAPA
jgi:hypothetical protein